jgi:NAD(P)-dependent dehydrogenase (short-subunit alcohol dehydrogenase family)
MSFPFSLKDKKILITGASGGIGKAIAIACGQMGAELILTGRDESKLKDTLQRAGILGSTLVADLTNEDEVHALVSTTDDLHGLVHCAGILKTIPFKNLQASTLDDIFNINFRAPVSLTQQLIKQKKIVKQGSIVYISSISGTVIGAKGNGAYSASKAAFNGLAKVLALELAPQKIRVNTIAPGMVKTDMWEASTSQVSLEQLQADEKNYPLGYGEPDDVAWAAVYLLSDASKWITGSNLIIDGGFTIH